MIIKLLLFVPSLVVFILFANAFCQWVAAHEMSHEDENHIEWEGVKF